MNNQSLPIKIGDYQLQKSLVGERFIGTYKLGLYKNLKNEICFAKRWVGKRKDIAYKWLYNEAILYKSFTHKDSKLSVNTPKFIDLVEDCESLTLFVEYIRGKHLTSLSINNKAVVYSKVLSSLSNYPLISSITHRPPLYWLGITPFVSLIAMIKHPSASKSIFRGFIKVIKLAPLVLARHETSLVHRDLNDNNIILYKNKIYLIDFELTVAADPLIDICILLLKNNCDSLFIQTIKKMNYLKSALANPTTNNVITCYMTIFSLYDLCFSSGLHKSSFIHLNSI